MLDSIAGSGFSARALEKEGPKRPEKKALFFLFTCCFFLPSFLRSREASLWISQFGGKNSSEKNTKIQPKWGSKRRRTVSVHVIFTLTWRSCVFEGGRRVLCRGDLNGSRQSYLGIVTSAEGDAFVKYTCAALYLSLRRFSQC